MLENAERIYTLETAEARLQVRAFGAELSSWQPDKLNEYIHQPDEQWQGQSPLLFPFVGSLEEQRYSYHGQVYKMFKHGFLRQRLFTYEAAKSYQTPAKACLCLSYTTTEADLAFYPFACRIEAYFYLEQRKLRQELIVTNLSASKMYFAAGFHPAFNLPKTLGTLSDFSLFFPEQGEIKRLQLNFSNGLQRSVADQIWLLRQGKWQWKVDDFATECWFFNTTKTNVELWSNLFAKPYLRLQSDLPVLGVWQPYREKKGADFICLEPWTSSVGPENKLADLTDWLDRYQLEVGANCSLAYTVEAML